ncbi:uncharacterized protein IUM83_07408 [Phytophthora cinnamomi]|uniref:uncharacterized protein n=1 Tax=Phytophthora cinnamomi TaxID=4785 RepID=UPI00355A29D8|nr:hypothetical protein IUM83_07408 [Phytophthora cinnamomi]
MSLQDETVNADDDGGAGAGKTARVFQLYQPGPAPDQVLQLCYLRRRAPRRLWLERTRIEDEFVLPRPELQISSLLPPAMDLPLEQLVGNPPLPSHSTSNKLGAALAADMVTIDQAKESARKHFLQPQANAVEDVHGWAALSEADWLQIFKSLQPPKAQPGQDDEMTGRTTASLPSAADVCWLVEQCPSDAFVGFVWNHMLISLLQQCVGSDQSACHHLLELLAGHHAFASLSPKDFRAKVRSRNLRQINDSFGAQAELALVALYRRQRDSSR